MDTTSPRAYLIFVLGCAASAPEAATIAKRSRKPTIDFAEWTISHLLLS
jgi:hypothetical protein